MLNCWISTWGSLLRKSLSPEVSRCFAPRQSKRSVVVGTSVGREPTYPRSTSMTFSIQKKWRRLKTLFSSANSSQLAVEKSTMTVPRVNPVSDDDIYICDRCQAQLHKGRRRSTTRICFRSINIGRDSPIFLREIVPCERCTPPDELRFHKFEASTDEIARVQKRMSMLPKDADWLQDFARIEVEKSRGKCTIRSNIQKPKMLTAHDI